MTLIVDYASLQTTVADYLNRQDLSAQIPGFVQLAEAKFNRELRVNDMLTTATPNASGETFTQPADFLEAYTLDMPANGCTAAITFVSPDEMRDLKAGTVTGPTRYCTLIGSTFHLWPAPTSALAMTLVYYAQVPALATNLDNWLLGRSPDLYLYSTLLEAQPYLKDDDRLATWATMREKLMDDIALESERAKLPTGQKVTLKPRTFG